MGRFIHDIPVGGRASGRHKASCTQPVCRFCASESLYGISSETRRSVFLSHPPPSSTVNKLSGDDAPSPSQQHNTVIYGADRHSAPPRLCRRCPPTETESGASPDERPTHLLPSVMLQQQDGGPLRRFHTVLHLPCVGCCLSLPLSACV